MTLNLEKLFNPKSVAVIGASRKRNTVGHGLFRNLVFGSRPFKGRVFPVNPNAISILGLKCYRTILDVKDNVDLAVIAVRAAIVPEIVNQCVKKKVGAIIIISAGFGELSVRGKKMEDEMSGVLRRAGIPMLGPNCLGIIRTANNLNASFAPVMPPAGSVAFISQSGALIDSVVDWSVGARYGFSVVVSYGNKAMLDVDDFFDYLDKDKNTKVIALYIEGVNDGGKFIKAAKKIKKPIIALKAGRSEQGIKAIGSHTGTLAGQYEIYKAAFKQSGVLLADTVEELFNNAKSLACLPKLKGGVGIITNGGGCGVLAADYCSELGVPLVKIKKSTLKKLDCSGKMHPAYSRANPLDIVGDALAERYKTAINVLLSEKYVGGLIVVQTLQSNTESEKDALAVIKARKKYPTKPVICVFMGGKFIQKAVNLLNKAGIPNYGDLKKAALAMKALSNSY